MQIERINTYDDPRFHRDILLQHGAFLVDGEKCCEFRITDERSAQVDYCDMEAVDELIEEYRFYTGHITHFYDKNGILLREFPSRKLFTLKLEEIQPSQFYVDREKLHAISSFITRGEDIIIPVMPYRDTGRYISEDGHTRLYYAWKRGFPCVRVFLEDVDDYIYDFVKEAERRGIHSVSDMEELSHEEYEVKWNQFCDDYFSNKDVSE